MFRRAGFLFSAIVLLLAGSVETARAQQTLNFTFGYLTVPRIDARPDNDILVTDWQYLTFDPKHFDGATVGGEWLVPLGRFFEAGAGVSVSSKSVMSEYTSYSEPSGAPIGQELKLRQVPFAFTVRALPFGQSSPVQPYIGGGAVVINWRYSESGDFVDFSRFLPDGSRPIFTDTFVGTGNTVGPVVLGGIRFAGRSASAGFEVRYQHATADLPLSEFASPSNQAPTIDLGGWTYQGTVGWRFGR